MPEILRVGSYRLLRRLDSGGMGTVWLGRCDPGGPIPADQDVAIKVVRPGGPGERIRFAREARYLQGLHHPGIVRVLDTGEDEQQAWLVMPLIEGRRLDDLGTTTSPRAADLVVQALEALHVAHLAGILHRDIKPGNLMLDSRGRVVLLDFGLAAAPDLESRLTREGDVVGTPAYMAPEQAAGRRDEIGRKSDLYAMGAVLYELVTGHQPFTGETTMATLRSVLEDPLVPPRSLRPEIPRPLERIILVAMAREPRDRYRTAEDMAADLRRWLAGRPVQAHPPSRLRLGLRSLYKKRRLVAMAGLVGFILVVGGMLVARTVMKPTADNLLQTAWVIERTTTGADLAWRPHATLSGDIAELSPVAGPVRLSVQMMPPTGGEWCELLVADRDIARGYRLRIQQGHWQLLREDRTMIQQDLDPLDPEAPITVVLSHDDGTLRGALISETTEVELAFDDLVPLQGPDADGVWLAVGPGSPRPIDVTLERRQTSEFVSALARADLLRQAGGYVRAQALYERFLRDQPNSSQARDARLRLALCLEAQGDRLRALNEFQALATDSDPRYALVATFHAWSCALGLGRFREAEQYFARIRRSYELPALAATIPASTLRDLRRDYLEQGRARAVEDPERAIELFFTASELANFLAEPEVQCESLTAAGDLLLALGRPVAARETWRRALLLGNSLSRSHRLGLLIRSGATGPLAGDPEGAALALAQAATLVDSPTDARRLALWQGELLASRGETIQAFTTWRTAGERLTPLGRMLLLLADLTPTPLDHGDANASNEGAWIAGRTVELLGRPQESLTWFTKAAAKPLTWPGALAKFRLLEVVESP